MGIHKIISKSEVSPWPQSKSANLFGAINSTNGINQESNTPEEVVDAIANQMDISTPVSSLPPTKMVNINLESELNNYINDGYKPLIKSNGKYREESSNKKLLMD